MEIGTIVKVLPPFDYAFPFTYAIEVIKEDGTCVIDGDRDFDPSWLEIVE